MKDIDYLVECMTKDLVLLLVEEMGMDVKTALHVVYTSDTYAKLQNPKTGLYFQSPRYVYDFLKTEIKTGKLG